MREKITVVRDKSGLHARPAACIMKEAKKYKSSVMIRHGDQECSAKSLLAILGMGIGYGEKIQVICDGPDESEALEALTGLLETPGYSE